MATEAPAAIEIRGLTKRFLGTLALDHVDLNIARGEIHALVGENGAGKSTLIKLLAGIHQPDHGEIRIDGKLVRPHVEPVPISFVHQDLGLINDMSIGENIALVAGFPRAGGLISWRRVWEQAEKIYLTAGLDAPDPRAPAGTLAASNRAVLAIVRALSRDARIIVLDEPTASLPGPDAERLFNVLRRLRGAGASILYVSHRLHELFGLVDNVTTLRDGRRVRTSKIEEISAADIVHDMLGRDLELPSIGVIKSEERHALLEISDLHVGNQGPISFTLAAGEIVGLAGLRGAGHETIGRSIFGDVRHSRGVIRLDGRELPSDLSVAERIARGIALLPSDRLGESALGGMTLRENMFPNLGNIGSRLFSPFWRDAEYKRLWHMLDLLDIRPRDDAALIEWLSGGNQQKVFIGRWLATKAHLYILEEPTAGVDIGAKALIHRTLRDVATQGAMVLVISSDFEEIVTLCDRALVMVRGTIVADMSGDTLTQDTLIARSSLVATATP
jgi:ribose transport system ATP-binding protein